MAVCISCGNEIAENAKFCINCGAPKAVAEETAAVKQEETKAEETATVLLNEQPEAVTDQPESAPVETEFIPKPLFVEREEKKPAYENVKIPNFSEEKQEPAPAVTDDKPGKKSKWAVISTKGYVGINLLMSIPVIGFILTIVWACGGCRKYAKRNYARAALIFLFAGIILMVAAALILRFAFPELIVQVFELLYPGYTIVF